MRIGLVQIDFLFLKKIETTSVACFCLPFQEPASFWTRLVIGHTLGLPDFGAVRRTRLLAVLLVLWVALASSFWFSFWLLMVRGMVQALEMAKVQ